MPVKRNKDIAVRVLGFVLTLLGTGWLALQMPQVQTGLAKKALEMLGDKLQGTIQVGSIAIEPVNSFTLTDVLILDDNPYSKDAPVDTFFFAKSISGTVSLSSILAGGGVYLSRAKVEDAVMHLTNEPKTDGSEGITNNLARIFGTERAPKREGYAATPDIFQIDKAECRGFRYRMTSYTNTYRKVEGSIDWGDLDITADILVHSLKYTGGRMSGIVDHFSGREKCGYDIISLTGRARVGMGKATIEKIHLVDKWSDIHAPLFSMGWNKVGPDFKYFLDRVRLELNMEPSVLSFSTIKVFSAMPKDPGIVLNVNKAQAKGYLSDLKISKLRFTEPTSNIAGDICGTVTGIPKVKNMLTDMTVKNLTFTTGGIQRLLKTLGMSADLSGIAPGTVFSFGGKVKGPLGRLSAQGKIGSKIGRAGFNLDIRNLADKARDLEIRGKLDTRNLDAGAISGVDALGLLTADTGFRATLGKKGPSVILDSLLIDKLGLLGYDYTGMKVQGRFAENVFDGRVISADPNLNFMLQGMYNISEGTFNVDGNIGYADLHAINLDKRGMSRISASLSADFRGTNSGVIMIGGLTVENELGKKDIGDISLMSATNGGSYIITLNSEFASGEYFGNKSIVDLPACLQTMTTRRELPAIYSNNSPDKGTDDLRCDISLDFHDSRDILAFAAPGLYIADSTRLTLEVGDEGGVEGAIHSSRLAWRTNYLKNLSVGIDNYDGSLNAQVVTDEMQIGELGFSNAALTGYARAGSFFAGYSYDGIRGIDNVGEIYLTGNLERDDVDSLCIMAKPLSSYIRFNGQQWDIDESEIRYRSGQLNVDGFRLHNGAQTISVDGGMALAARDTLRVGITDVDISVMNYFIKDNYDIQGRTTGLAVITSPLKDGMLAIASVGCDSLKVDGSDAGTLRLSTVWDSAKDKVTLFLRNWTRGVETLSASGSFRPKAKTLSAKAELDGMNLIVAKPFLNNILSEISGGMSGTIYANGHLDSLKISSERTRINNARIKPSLTEVAYTLNGPFHVDNRGLHFDNISIVDAGGGAAALTGGIGLRGLKDIMFNIGLKLRSLQLLDRKGSEGLRGNIFATGDVYLTGPPDAMLLDAVLSTVGDGNVHVPLGSAASASTSNLLTFTSHEITHADPYDDMIAELLKRRKKASAKKTDADFMARLKIATTPSLQAVLELDNTGGNILKFRGDGTFNINMHPSKDVMDISGDYKISEGSYRFAMPGVSRDFTIDDGSSIAFNGDIMESSLDIGATYSLRTSLNKLLADTSSVSTRRTVNCGIHISDRLMAPSVAFSIDVPDLDPTTKAEVQSALNTEDKIQKQFIALLVTGSFIPEEQSGIVNSPNILYSNVSEIMSRQLSDLLSRLDIPLDMGLGYQQNSSGADLFDVAVSTELFNNRVIVNGSVGNRQNRQGTSSNSYGEVVGDLDIDYKLDKSGQTRINLFSHSADDYSSFLDNTQRNGAGITYQKEFYTWKEFFRDLFSTKAQREARAAERATRKEEKTVVTIDE